MIVPAATLEDLKNVSDVVSNGATAAAILIGGVWAYLRFFRERTRWPRAALLLELTDRRLDAATVLLNAKLTVKNEGRGLMHLAELRFDLYRVSPLDPKMRAKLAAGCAHTESGIEADWISIECRNRIWDKKERPELEPGESDEYLGDFFLDPAEETVFLYAYLRNVKKGKIRRRKLGWTVTAFHDLQPSGSRGRLASLLPGGGS